MSGPLNSSLLSFSLVLSLAVACKVGDTSQNAPNVAVDATAAVIDGGGGGGEGPDAQAADPDCEPAAAPNGNGRHNAGVSCIESGCHDGAGEPPLWTLAGTLYVDKEGTTPLAGGTLVFTDANDAEFKLKTAANGNFFTNDVIAFPIQVKASVCPNSLSMVQGIDAAMASCNKAGCHVANDRVYVPE